MSAILLSLRTGDLRVSIDHGIVARVLGYPSDQDESDPPYYTELTIPASETGKSVRVDVRPGRYRVQAILPSGKILQEQADVAEGDTATIVFGGGPLSGHVGWPQFDGREDDHGPAAPRIRPVEDLALERHRSDRGPAGIFATLRDFLGGRINVDIDPDLDSGAFSGGWRGAGPAASLTLHEQVGDGAKAWRTVASAIAAEDVATIWSAPEDARIRLEESGQEGDLSLWHLDADTPFDLGPPRLWTLSDVADVAEIASIPLPWRFLGTSPGVEISVDSGDGDASVRTLLAIRDPVLGGLLAYLGRGRLANLRPLVDGLLADPIIRDTIFAKRENPLGACAAAYVGLAVLEPGEPEPWDEWLGNLMDWFPSLPDGAIVHARRIILRPGSPAETEAALAALKEAYRRGIPYFTAGVLGLRDMLSLFRDRDAEAAAMLTEVARVASRLDVRQAFTVLSFPKPL